MEVSEKARLFTGALRRSIEIRDRECTHPYCDIEADKCHHIIPSAAGGLTTQENGRLLCGFHNRQRNGLPPPGDEIRPTNPGHSCLQEPARPGLARPLQETRTVADNSSMRYPPGTILVDA